MLWLWAGIGVDGRKLTTYRPRSAGLQQYLGALNRVDRALADLNATNLRSNQKAVAEFSALLSAGSTKLQDLYRSTLRENVHIIEPLHYLTKRTLLF